jgi:hypothetical protein
MDEQVIQDLYNRAVSLGYKKSREEFISLLQSDSDVQNDNYAYVQSQGYSKSMNDFLGLVGGGGSVVEQAFATANQIANTPQRTAQTGELPRMPKPGELDGIGQEDDNAFLNSQGEYNVLNSLPSEVRGTAKQIQAENEVKKKAEQQAAYDRQVSNVKLGSELDSSAQQSLVESTARQQEEASLLASQQLEADTQKMPFLKNDFLRGVYQELKKEQNLPDFVKDQLNQITPDLINLGEFGPTSMPNAVALLAQATPFAVVSGAMSQNVAGLSVEEAVVPKMNYMFGPLGFTFEESGMTGDFMTVKAPNKETIEISLNNLTESDNIEESKKLKNFIASNATKIPQIEKFAAEYAGSNAKFSSEKAIEDYTKSIGKEYDELNKNALSLSNDIKNFESSAAELNSVPDNLRNTPEYLQKKKDLEAALLDINKRRQDIISKNDTLEAQKYNLEKSVGKYAQTKAEQGTWTGASYTWLGESLASMAGGLLSLGIDASSIDYTGDSSRQTQSEIKRSVSDKVATGNIEQDIQQGGYIVDAAARLNKSVDAPTSEEELNKIMSMFRREGGRIIKNNAGPGMETLTAEEKKALDIFEKYIPLPKEGQSYKDWYNSLDSYQQNQLRLKIEDDETKRAKKVAIPAVREYIQGTINDPNTTVEWRNLAEEGFWGGAYAGLVKSAPAMAMPGGWAARTASFFAMGTDAVNQEMDKNPAFDEVSESEKLLVTVPIGIANAVLEEIGLSNMIKNKGFVNSLVLKAMQKAGVNTTESALSKIIKNDVESMLARGTLTLAGAGLAEAETGAGQQVAEYAVKDIYNIAKKKEMFDTPDSLKEYVYDVVRAGAQEAVGGMIMGAPGAAAAAYRKRGYEGMSDLEFKIFEGTANDDKIQSAFIASLKTKVASGDMTMEEAKEQLNDYRKSVGLYRKIDDGLSLKDKKEAMNLLKERGELEQRIQGKDPAMTKKQRVRITAINAQLDELASKPAPEVAPEVEEEIIGGLTEKEQNRKADLEETLASREEDEKNGITSFEVTDGEGGVTTVTYEEAQAELDALNEKVAAAEVKTEQQVPTVLATADATASALEALPENERSNIKFKQEDGTETPVMGNEKMLAELFQQAQAVPEEDRTDFHQNIIDVVTLSLSDQIEEETQQQEQVEEETDAFQDYSDDDMITFEVDTLEEVPEEFRGIAYESGPMEVTARKGILGLPIGKKRVVKRKGKTFRFTISGLKAKTNAKVLEGVQLINTEQSTRPERATTKAQLFANVSKSLASIFPNVGIRNFKNNEEMKAYVDSKYKDSPVSKQIFGNEGGMIIYDEQGNPSEIIINDKTSTATTLPHEVWHAILVKAFGENEALFTEFRDEIRKTLVQNGFNDIVDALDKFSSSPEYKASNKQAQEWLVEFGGLLTASGVTMENIKKPEVRNLLNQIKEIFNKITMEMFGYPAFLDYADAEQILDFIVSMSDSLSRGEDISKNFSRELRTKGAASTVSKQTGGNPAEEVRRIAQRYNVSNTGFAPSQVNEFALDKELRPYGYSAKRAAPDANGRQRGVYILNPKGRFYNPFKGKFQKVSSQTTQPKVKTNAREKQIYNTKTLVNKLTQLTGIPVNYIDDPAQRFKGKIEDRVATINLAYVTKDTPIHEILGHPVIASLKETDRAFYDKLANEVRNSNQGANILARIKEDYSEYTEEQQIEEAIVEMLSLMVSDRLEDNSVLKTMLKKLLQDIVNFINKAFKTKFGESDVINMSSLSKDIENYINQTESAFERSIDDLVNLFLGSNTSTYLSVSPNEITVDGRKMLKKKYGETLSREISSYIVDAPLYADKFMKFMDNMLLDPSQAKMFLSNKTNLSYVNYKFSNFIHKGEEIKKRSDFADPFKLLYDKQYELTPVKDEDHLWTFQKDYDKGYTICTFNSTAGAAARLASNFIFWIRKPYASDILPYNMLTQDYLQSNSADAAEWRKYLKEKGLEKEDGTFQIPKKASIYDPYAVSSISLQISRDPKSDFQKMVNRYNHAVDIGNGGDGNADAAFNNRLNDIVQGLDDAVRNYANLPIRNTDGYTYDKAISVGDKLFVYNEEINNHYVSPQGYVKDGVYHKINPDLEIISSGFVFNKRTKTVTSFEPTYKSDFFADADDVIFEKSKIIVKSSKLGYTTELTLDEFKNIIGINSDTTRDIENNFFVHNRTLEFISLPNVQKIGWHFLNNNTSLTEINLPSVVSIDDSFLGRNQIISSVYLPEVKSIGSDFLVANNDLESISLPKVLDIGDNFIASNRNISSVNLPELRSVGKAFLEVDLNLESISLPNLKIIGDDFLYYNKYLSYISLPKAEVIGNEFLHDNGGLISIDLPNVLYIGEAFLANNESLNKINLPNVTEIGMDFLIDNKYLQSINLPNLDKLDAGFMYRNDNMRFINTPKLETISKNFLRINRNLESIYLPNAIVIDGAGFLHSNEDLEASNINSSATIKMGLYGFMPSHTFITDENRNIMPDVALQNSQLYTELNDKLGFERLADLYSDFLSQNKKGTMVEFYNTVSGEPSVSAQRGGVLQESLEQIPGYELMVNNSKKVALRTSRRYGADWNRVMNAVMEYVMNSKVYELANDSQREQLVRNVRAEFGKKEKTAPSPTKVFELPTVVDLFGPIADVKMITMPELQFLNEQMKTLVRGAKEARVNWMAISKQVAKQIKELVIAGKISNRQAASVISRLAMVNMFNQDSIDKFTDYMVKVFNDANYDLKIENARKKLPRARKNILKKIGIANAVAPSLAKLFAINPNLIPDSILETYLEIVDMFGSSDSVLNLADIDLVVEDVKAILDAVDNEVSLAEELALRFEEFTEKVYDDEGNLEYAKTITKMIEREAIDDAEAEVMRKYKKIIFPKVKEADKTAAEIEEEKKALIKAIKAVTVNTDRLPSRLERDLAKRLVALLKPELLKQLSVNQLENVSKLLDNINAGYLPRYAMITVEKLNSVQMAANDLETAIADGKALKVSGFIGKIKAAITGKTAELEMIRRSPLVFIDQIFGDFKTKRIFDSVFGMLARGQAAFDTDINKVNQRLDDARNSVSKSHGYDANATLESSYRMMAYMIQLEYESNLGSDQVNPASSFIKATVKRMLNDKTNKFKERDAVLLENILKEYGVDVGTDKNGKPIIEIDNKKLYKSFNTAERNALKTIREINDGLTDKAQYTASVIRGESITPLNNYVHLPVLHDYDPNERSTGIQNSTAYNNSRRPSTKAKTLEGRTGDVSPINFDAFASAQKGAKATLLDFHLTEAIRTSRKTINETRKLMEEKGTLRGSKRDLLNAIESANEEVIRNVLTNNFVTDSFADAVVNEVSKQGYRAILASSKRFVAELSSNVGFVLFTDPKAFSQGLKKETRAIIMSPSAVNVMDNVGSKQTSRLFSGDSLSGRFIDTSILGQASGVRTNKVQGTVKNVSNIIYNKSLKKLKNRFELVADSLISTPDKLVMRPVWFGAFSNEFKKQTGSEVDFDKIAANDEAYMAQHAEAISKARDAADEKSTLTGASDNPFMGILKGAVTADQSGMTRAFNNFNNFMTRFAIYEFAAARQGIYAAMGDGTLTRKQGAALLGGVITRMTTYTLLSNVLGSLLISAFGDEEEEETEKSFMQKFEQALASTATSLLVGRDFGNTVKLFSNVGVEKINEEYFDFLRNGDYDPYEDYISYSALPKERKGHQTDLGDYALMFTGSFTPLAKTIDLGIRKLHEEPKKEGPAIERQKAEIYKRLPIEMLGHMGLIPMYNEVRAVLMSQIYSSLQQEIKASKVSEKERAIEKEKLGKYETRTDMKRYDPELYEKTFGPGSPGYDAEQAKKKLAEEKNEAKRAEKDAYFGYQESYTDRIDREDRERIEKIKESPNYDPNAVPTKDLLTRSELKEYFPEDYEKRYGEDSEYYKEKEPENKEQKIARAKRKAMLDKAYGKSTGRGGSSTDRGGSSTGRGAESTGRGGTSTGRGGTSTGRGGTSTGRGL